MPLRKNDLSGHSWSIVSQVRYQAIVASRAMSFALTKRLEIDFGATLSPTHCFHDAVAGYACRSRAPEARALPDS
jgi:hypothetical protein